jgi:hypothetical protein
MNVIDLPKRASHALYDEAVARYASAVRTRAVAVYRSGPARYPGLSPLELLVVTGQTGLDNRFFFSALQRLPERYHALFVREPFMLPAWSLRVMRHTNNLAPQLAAGRGVLAPYSPNDDSAERWCRLLESYCAYAAFVENARDAQLLNGRQTMAAASGFRKVLADAAGVIPEAANDAYANHVEALCRSFFDEGAEPVERVRTTWKILARAFDTFDAIVRSRLQARTTQEAVETARTRLLGEEHCEEFDRDYAFRRAREIDGYHQELASLGLPFGHLFFVAAYPRAVRSLPRAPVIETLLSNLYRVRRRLTEYAAGV